MVAQGPGGVGIRPGLAADALVDHQQVAYQDAGGPRRLFRSPSSAADALLNIVAGPLPWHQSLLYHYFLVDLCGQKFEERYFLDRVSETGLLYSRWYRDEGVAAFLEQNVMHAAAIYANEISAMSWQHVMRYWLRTPSPFFSTVDGPLQTRIIDPFAAHLVARGVTIITDRRVTAVRVAGGQVSGVEWRDSGGATGTLAADCYVLATPLEVTKTLITDELYALAPDLGCVQRLDCEPMSGFCVDLTHKVPGLGAEFTFLMGSAHALSVIDVTPSAPTSRLCVVVSDFGPLRSLTPAKIEALILAELRRYLAFPTAWITATALQDNVSAPLYINTVGSWADRPEARTQAPNLWVAGDWVRNAIDLATMEGAVASGRDTASLLLRDLGLLAPPAKVPPTWPRSLSSAS